MCKSQAVPSYILCSTRWFIGCIYWDNCTWNVRPVIILDVFLYFLCTTSSSPYSRNTTSDPSSSEKDEEPLKMQISDMNQRISKEKARGAKLKQKVQLLGSLNTEDQVRKRNVSTRVLIFIPTDESSSRFQQNWDLAFDPPPFHLLHAGFIVGSPRPEGGWGPSLLCGWQDDQP